MNINKLPFFLLFSSLAFLFGCQKEQLCKINIIKTGKFSWTEKEDCTIVYTKDGINIDMPAQIKKRGGHSARYDKNSFALELRKKYELSNLPKDDDWILNASYIDKTFMRHKISYDLYRQMHKDNIAAETDYIELSINGDYHGLYILTEEVNRGKIGIKKDDIHAMLFKDPPIFYPEKIEKPQDPNNYFQQKYPKIQDLDHSNYLKGFQAFLFDSSDEEFEKSIGDWIDLRNIIDWQLLLFLSYNGDGIMKNFYLYKKDKATPFRIAIWDYDHSFGRDGDNELNIMDRPFKWRRSILFTRLMKIDAYRNNLHQRWAELRDSGLFSLHHINRMIHDIDHKIKPYIHSNEQRWPIDSKWYYDANDYKKEKLIIPQYLEARLPILDSLFLR